MIVRRGRASILAGTSLAISIAACSPDRGDAYKKAFSAAERAQTAGRYDEAARDYQAASDGAKIDHDKIFARYLSGLMHARAGDVATAAQILDPIAKASPENDYSALAAFKIAELRIAHGEEARGWSELEDVAIRFPWHGVARVALRRVEKRQLEVANLTAALAWVSRVKDLTGHTGVAEAASYERAKLLREDGRKTEARDAMIEVANTWGYPEGSFFDDSLYAASELDEELGDVPRAIADLERMHDVREVAYLYGSYQRPKFSAGLYRQGVLYAEKMHDRAKAREMMHALYTEYKTSTLRDAALFYEAKLYADDGDHANECATLRTLVEKLVDSKYVPCAEQKCVDVKRDAKSKAPKACHVSSEKIQQNEPESISGENP